MCKHNLQGQCVDTLVCGRKERAVVATWIKPQPIVNRGFCSFVGLHSNSFVRASEQIVHDSCLRYSAEQKRWSCTGPIDLSASAFARLGRPAASPCAASRDPPLVCSGFGFDRFFEDRESSLKMAWGFFDFPVRGTKNPSSSIFGAGGMKNPAISQLSDWNNEGPLPHSSSSDPPLDQLPPGRLSYLNAWMFCPMFILEDRSEDRDRPSTRSVVSWARRLVGFPSFPDPLFPAALPYAAESRPTRGMSKFLIR